jgi:PKD repeat protein
MKSNFNNQAATFSLKIKCVLSLILFFGTGVYGQSVYFTAPAGGCAPYSGVFNNMSSGVDSLLWDFGDGGTSNSMAASVPHSYVIGGWHQVTLRGWSSGVFAGEWHEYVMVEGFPGNLTVSPVCPGDEFNVSANLWTANQFNWDMQDGTTYNLTYDNMYHVYNAPGTYNASLDVSFPTCGMYSGIIPIDVITNAPLTDGYANVSNDSICPGDEISFYQNWQYNYRIDYGDGLTYTSSGMLPDYGGREHTYMAVGSYYPSITLVNGCGNDTTIYDTITVSNSLSYTPVVQLNLDDDTVCVGTESRVYTYTQAGTVSYDWGDGSQELNPDEFEFISYSSPGVYAITVTATTGCGITQTETDNLVAVSSLPIQYASLDGPDSVCLGSGAYFGANVDGEESYLWDMGDGSSYTTEAVSHVFATIGNYNVQVTVSNGCGGDSVLSQSIEVSNSYGFGPNSFALGYPEKGCAGDTALILFIPGNGNTYEVNYGSGFVPETPSLFDPGYGFFL